MLPKLIPFFRTAIVTVLWCGVAHGMSSGCDSYLADLDKMNQAHGAIMLSYANSSESFATTLSTQAEQYRHTLKDEGHISLQDLSWLDKTASIYRASGQKSRVLAQQYVEEATQLIASLSRCLKAQQK